MTDLTVEDIEELLAEGIWRNRNNLEDNPLIDKHWNHTKSEYEQWQDELNAKRKPEPLWQVLVGGAICCIVVALLLLFS